MPTYECNHCHTKIKNNGGTAREIGMFYVGTTTYCVDCAKLIISEFLEEF